MKILKDIWSFEEKELIEIIEEILGTEIDKQCDLLIKKYEDKRTGEKYISFFYSLWKEELEKCKQPNIQRCSYGAQCTFVLDEKFDLGILNGISYQDEEYIRIRNQLKFFEFLIKKKYVSF